MASSAVKVTRAWRPQHVEIFADGAEISEMSALARNPLIRGFTTNPTLMLKSGVGDYERFAGAVLSRVNGLPVSFEVVADDPEEMEAQAHKIASWGSNVVVKIPVTTTTGESTCDVVGRLARKGIAVNVTALMTVDQVREVRDAFGVDARGIVSVFAGRIADTGRDPLPIMEDGLALLRTRPRVQLLWASPREILNVVQADAIGCDIITVTYDLLGKIATLGRDLAEYSLETVRMFYRDANQAGLRP